MDKRLFVAEENCKRLDVFLSEQTDEVSRSRIKKLIEEGQVSVNGVIVTKAGEAVKAGDSVSMVIPEAVEYAVANVDSITFVKKEGIVLKAKVPAFWGTDIYVHVWGTEGVETGDYKATKQGDWYVYAYPGKEINILFKSGMGWKGYKYQTEDIRATKSACYLFTQEGDQKATVTETDCMGTL